MSSDLIWLTVIVNVIIGVVTVVNTWALAWYNNKRADVREKPSAPASALTKKKRKAEIPGWAMAIVAVCGLALSLLAPSPSINEQIFRVAFFIGAAFFGLAASAFASLLARMLNQADAQLEHVRITKRLVAIVEKITGAKVDADEP